MAKRSAQQHIEDVGQAARKLADYRPPKSKEEALEREAEVMERVRAEQAKRRSK